MWFEFTFDDLNENNVIRIINKGLDEYIRSINKKIIGPPCYEHLSYAVNMKEDSVIFYILQNGVSPNNKNGSLVMNQVLHPEFEYYSCYEPLVILLFKYGAKYDSSMLRYLSEENRDSFLYLEKTFLPNFV